MESKLPLKYLENMKELLKEEFDDYLSSFSKPSFNGLRINTNKVSVKDFLNKSPFELKKVDWINNGFYYFDNDRPSKHPYYYAGLYYLQEPSAMTPAKTIEIEENDYVLDVCAAPGGKSTELANKLKNTGILVANDISVSRSQALLKNLELSGCKNAFVISEDTDKLKKNFPHFFNKILIDAPCSGEGMFRKDNSLIKSWETKGNEYYANIQKQIVKDCLEMLADNGQILYSTCTFSPLEDEETINYLLSLDNSLKVKKMMKLFPHKIDGEGHFVCLIEKSGNKPIREDIKYNSTIIPNCVLDFLKHTKLDLSQGYIDIFNDKVLLIPNVRINTKGLRVLRSGLLLGTINKDKFEPSQALAMALKKEEFDNILDLDCNDIRVIKYLKGETITANEIGSGYCLVCTDGFPLGFAKYDNKNLKNKYEKGWRYQ